MKIAVTLRAALLPLGVLALGYLGIGLFVVHKMTGPGRRLPQATPANAGLAYEDVELASTDGVRLSFIACALFER